MSYQPFRILIFDSGVGGLSIYHALRNEFERASTIEQVANQYCYFADHGAAPYGNKPDDWLNTRITQVVTALNHNLSPHLIIIACNTASTLALDNLRKLIDVPIIGVVPAIKTAALLAIQQGCDTIGLLATPATVKRQYIRDLAAEFAQGLTMQSVGSTQLVDWAENKLNGQAIDSQKLKLTIQPFIDKHCRHVVLGCTHFPLLADELKIIAPEIEWIDSGAAIAQRASHIKSSEAKAQTNLGGDKNFPHFFYSSGEISTDLKQYLTQVGFDSFVTNHLPL